MKKPIVAALFVVLALLLCSCTAAKQIPDGSYRIEAASFDARGYKDYIEFTFLGGELVSMTADAVSQKGGTLKTADEAMRTTMEEATGTYPEKFYKDLVNQYIEELDVSKVDIVAGATTSSKTFISLMTKAEKAAKSGDATAFTAVG